jgi:DMSO reductase family type II enzyme heme b subunit
MACTFVLFFLGVVFLPHCRSKPAFSTKQESSENMMVVKYLAENFLLDPSAKVYEPLKATEIPLFPQLLIKPFGADQKPPIRVKAAHNGKEIIFLVEWEDKTENRGGVREPDKFSDACGVMFPRGEINDANAAALMMGFLVPVEIWHWKSDRDQVYLQRHKAPKEHPEQNIIFYSHDKKMLQALKGVDLPTESIQSKGPGTLETKQSQLVLAKGVNTPGKWQIIFKRALHTGSNDDFNFQKGTVTRMAFAVWDGAKQERGSQKSISDWVRFYIE